MKQLGRWRPTLDPGGTLAWTSTTGRVRTTEPAHRLVSADPAPEPVAEPTSFVPEAIPFVPEPIPF
jgi:hypothetical protein